MSEASGYGKGDRQRKPVDKKKFEDNWDKIFGKKKLSTEKLDSGFKSSKKADSK